MKILLFLLLTLFFAAPAQAAESPWVEAKQAKVRLLVAGGREGKLHGGVEYQLHDGWKTYWRSPGDAGMPSSLQFDGSTNINPGAVMLDWPLPERYVDVTGLQDFVYKDQVIVPFSIPLQDAAKETVVKLKLDYLVCRELCIPLSAGMEVSVPPGVQDEEAAALIAPFTAKVPGENGAGGLTVASTRLQTVPKGGVLEVEAVSEQGWNIPDIVVEEASGARFLKPQVLLEDGTHARFVLPVEGSMEKILAGGKLQLTLINDNARAVAVTVPAVISTSFQPLIAGSSSGEKVPASLLWVMLVAVLGGFILNVMPCVLPVLSIKLLSVVRHGGGESQHIRASFLASAAGVICSFLLIAIGLIVFKQLGYAVGFGFQFQQPYFLIALVLVLVVFACNLWGLFEINLPQRLSGLAIDSLEEKGSSLFGAFLTGAFATLLATPCSAPFVGTAISFALSRGSFEIILIFAAMGVGLALPYLLLSLVPGWVSLLPKPGAWMQKVRYILGIALIATAIWLIWVLSNQLGTAAALLLLLLCLLFKFVLETHTGLLQRGAVRGGVIAVIIGLAFLLPLKTYEFNRAQAQLADEVWQVFDEAAIPALVSSGKIVVVDVTADWCLSCKINKLTLFERFDILKRFQQPDIVAMRADLTSPNPMIIAYLKRFKRYGIPFNVVYGPAAPEGIPLSELPSKGELMLAIRQAGGQEGK